MRTAALLLLGLAAGCVAPAEEFPPEPTCTPEAGDGFCTAYAERFCTAHLSCCTDDALRHPSMETCVARTTCICVGTRQGDAFADGRVALDPIAADALLVRMDDLAASCDPIGFGEIDVETVMHGTLAAGADCSPVGTDFSPAYACGAGLYCQFSELGEDGVRGACRPYAGEGESCGEVECARGLWCDEDGCRPQLDPGSPCEGDYECKSDLCDEDTLTCTALAPAEAYCTGDASEFEEGSS